MTAKNGLPAAAGKPRARFVTVVWGKAYIQRFSELSLASFMAPGNLPALAGATALDVVIMTRQEDIRHFESLELIQRLRGLCQVVFVAIDDLVTTGVYGVTLTLAYARAVIALGSEMLNTHFVFMNADFVLADGSLRALVRHILAKRSIVLGPSFRATAEAVEPHLHNAVDSAGVLAIAPRRLAALSLPHPHPTTVAKILTQGFCHSTQPNQFFWQVDEGTLLGRYYLIFMLCLKPERVITTINSFCDYAFIPELCPSGDEVAMDDSDDFFMLELQRSDQELYLLQLGGQTDAHAVKTLRRWTTREHRRAAGYNIVFHTGEISPAIEAAKAQANAFVERIATRLGKPIRHDRHFHWILGVVAWRRFRAAHNQTMSPPELDVASTMGGPLAVLVGKLDPVKYVLRRLWSFSYIAQEKLIGRWPGVTLLHPAWLDGIHLRRTIREAVENRGAGLLVVTDELEHISRLVGEVPGVQYVDLDTVLNKGLEELAASRGRTFDSALIYVLRKDVRKTRRLVDRCQPAMSPGSACRVFIHHLRGESESGNFSYELTSYAEEIVGWSAFPSECSYVGGSFKFAASRTVWSLAEIYLRNGFWVLPLVLPLFAGALLAMGVVNLAARGRLGKRDYVPFCSSVSIRFPWRRSQSEATPSAARASAPGAAPRAART